MYHHTAEPALDRRLTSLACYCLVILAIIFGALAFWEKGAVPGILLTVGFGSLSLILAGVATRLAEAIEKQAPITVALVSVVALVCILFEANLTHNGLAYLNDHHDIAPESMLWLASYGLSLFNLISVYALARPLSGGADQPRAGDAKPRSFEEQLYGPGDREHEQRMSKWESVIRNDPEIAPQTARRDAMQREAAINHVRELIGEA